MIWKTGNHPEQVTFLKVFYGFLTKSSYILGSKVAKVGLPIQSDFPKSVSTKSQGALVNSAVRSATKKPLPSLIFGRKRRILDDFNY